MNQNKKGKETKNGIRLLKEHNITLS